MTDIKRIAALALAAATLAAGLPAVAQTVKVQTPVRKIAPGPNQRENQAALNKSLTDKAFRAAYLKGDVNTVKSILVRNGASKHIAIAIPVLTSSDGGVVDSSLGNWYCGSGHYKWQWIAGQYINVFYCDYWIIDEDVVTRDNPD